MILICVHLRLVFLFAFIRGLSRFFLRFLRSLRSFAAIPDLRISDESRLISTDPLYLLSAICYLL